MSAEYIQNIEALASAFPSRNVTLYFPDFATRPPADSLNQVFGAPVGVRADNWPTFAGLPALLEQIGEALEDPPRPADGAHLLHRPCGASTSSARRPGPASCSSISATPASTRRGRRARRTRGWSSSATRRSRRGPFKGPLPARSRDRELRRFTLVPVTVPAEVFAVDPEDKDTPLGKLRKAIWAAPGRLGGEPIWLQGDPRRGRRL
jgi:hypothetical protein